MFGIQSITNSPLCPSLFAGIRIHRMRTGNSQKCGVAGKQAWYSYCHARCNRGEASSIVLHLLPISFTAGMKLSALCIIISRNGYFIGFGICWRSFYSIELWSFCLFIRASRVPVFFFSKLSDAKRRDWITDDLKRLGPESKFNAF